MDGSVLSDGDLSDYDIVSEVGSSIADLHHVPGQAVYEPPPSQGAQDAWETVRWDKEDVRAYVKKALESSGYSARPSETNGSGRCDERRTVRVYVDGSFEVFNAGHALQFRQAKLSFPTVHLIVGVFSDEISMCKVPHVERCELVRHCRWVDEVMRDAPLTVDEAFVRERKIDYVAVEEGISVDPAYDMVRVKAYDALKKLGKVIPTRKTFGLRGPSPSVQWPVLSPTTPVPRNAPFNEDELHETVDKFGIGF